MFCTFFGHADAPKEIETMLISTLTDLIENKNVNIFYVGNNGNFDRMVQNVLFDLSKKYKINCYIVLAYLPNKQTEYKLETLLPNGIELQLLKFSISYRNKWMIEKSDYIVTYVTRTFGGAYQFKTSAEKKGKKVINISI